MILKLVATRLPEDLVDEIDERVDGLRFRTRTHFFEVALRNELERIEEGDQR